MLLRITFVGFAITAIASGSLRNVAYGDDSGIPPEILKQMDPAIRSGKRPMIATLRKNDIFGLREKPKLKGDFVRLDFDVESLSSVQREIMKKWIRSGANRICLRDGDLLKFNKILAPVEGHRSKRFHTKYAPGQIRNHAVNTDCQEVKWATAKLPVSSGNRIWYERFLPTLQNLPSDSIVLAETDSGQALCGRFMLGRGDVLFRLSNTGTDARRWNLNFWHWAMGLAVPGRTETAISGANSNTLDNAERYDTLILTNGDTITGRILNKSFKIRTSYAGMTLECPEIAEIRFEGGGNAVDTIMLRNGDGISGTVESKSIAIELRGGQKADISRDKIEQIRFKKKDTSSKS